MGVVAAILGLAILVMIHEAGHFFAARAVGMTPRKFYLGFGPPIAKTTRGGVEYGIGSIPLGGYVKIPGMNRPSAGDLAATLNPEAREQYRAELARLDDAIEREDYDAAHVYLNELRPALGETRMWQELEWSLAPDAYWRQTTWRRLTAIFAGPAVNLVFARRALRVPLHGRERPVHERHRSRRQGQPSRGRARPRGRPDPAGRGSDDEAGRHPRAHPRHAREAVPADRPPRWQARRARTAARQEHEWCAT